jgi:uncharacterized repeat protein (TIGR01451 family)
MRILSPKNHITFVTVLCTIVLNGAAQDIARTCDDEKGHDPTTEIPPQIALSIVTTNQTLTLSKPIIISRTDWGCPDGENSPEWEWKYTNVSHLILHHSATSNTNTDWGAHVLQIFYYHRDHNGWGDIGYNYLIDPNGVIYEGRAGGDNVIGAHFSCMNGGTMGVCLLGTFESIELTQAALNSLVDLLAWSCDQHELDPLATAYHISSQLTLPRICGHKDGNSSTAGCPSGTACPGAQLYAQLPKIRTAVDHKINGTNEVNLICHSHTIGDTSDTDNEEDGRGNNNGTIDAGEEIALTITLKNTGTSSATNVTATLTTPNAYVVIHQDAGSWLPIEPKSAETSTTAFEFNVLNSCPTNTPRLFLLHIASEQTSQIIPLTLHVTGALPTTPLMIQSFQVTPGTLTIEFTSQVEKTYIIQASTNLIRWQELLPFINEGRALTTPWTLYDAHIGTQNVWFIRMIETE